MTERDRDIARRFIQAEGQTLKDRPPEKQVKWFKTRCPECGVKVEYSLKPNWNGQLKCGTCQHEFRLTLLDHFSIEFEEEMS